MLVYYREDRISTTILDRRSIKPKFSRTRRIEQSGEYARAAMSSHDRQNPVHVLEPRSSQRFKGEQSPSMLWYLHGTGEHREEEADEGQPTCM